MNIRYTKLFEIRNLHLYYKGRSSGDLKMVPTGPTKRMMTKYRLELRQMENGIVVLAPVSGDPAKLQFPIGLTEGFALAFKLKMANPYFLNFTELPFTKPSIPHLKPLKTGYYFSNLQDNEHQLSNPDQDLKLLSRKNASPVSEEDRLSVWMNALRAHLDPPVNNLSVEITDEAANTVFSETKVTATPFSEYAPEKPPYLRPGIYNLKINGGAAQRLYIDDEIYHSPPFGVIEVFHNTSVPDDYKFVGIGTDDVPVFQSYHLLFEARSTIWRYRFPGGLTGITSLKKGATNFNAVAADKLYESPAAIKMTDEYQTVQMTRSAVSKNIPNPSIASVKPDPVSGEVYADIYL